MQDQPQHEFLNELCPHLRPMIAHVAGCECGIQALDFFRRRPHAWLQMGDIAYHLNLSRKQTAALLRVLIEERILERICVLDTWTFYGLSQRPESLAALDQFWAWRDDWHARIQHVRAALELPAIETAPSGSI